MANDEKHSQRLDIPLQLHLDVQQVQINRRREGEKINLNDLYVELIKKGLRDQRPMVELRTLEEQLAMAGQIKEKFFKNFTPAKGTDDEPVQVPHLIAPELERQQALIVYKKDKKGNPINDIDTTASVKALLEDGLKAPAIAKLLDKDETIIYKAIARLKKKGDA